MADVEALEKSLRGLSLAEMGSSSLKSPIDYALELFEVAAAKEQIGQLTEAVDYYRKAYKLDEKVDMHYRERLVNSLPPLEKRKDGIPLEDYRFKTMDLSKINVRKLLASFDRCEMEPQNEEIPVVALAVLPDEILLRIMETMVLTDTPSWFNFSMSCKKLAYLGLYDSTVWRKLAQIVYDQQVYRDDGKRRRKLIKEKWGRDWLKMLRERPFIKYCGIYVSTVICQKEGDRTEFSSSWNKPFRSLTYYRYYRFFPDGKCLKLLTIMEPQKVARLLKRDWGKRLSEFNETVSQEEMPSKRWQRVYEGQFTIDLNGHLVVKSEGALEEWLFFDELDIVNAGKYARHHKLQWDMMGYQNKKTGEEGTFSLQDQKDFMFLRC